MEPYKKMNMTRDRKDVEYPVELETQFILRLPEEPANKLREVLRLGENFKNRLSIQMENDMRHGEVRFDEWLLHAKVVDLPTIVESLKTVDRKSVYKTADICQMMICKDEIDPPAEEESTVKNKKKDPYKVDKKFLFPHGVTPPTKNVRKRRFRKTLKKKSVEAPEIEKEVKRLLRADNEAVSITWEIIEEAVKEDETNTKPDQSVAVKPEKAKTKKEQIKAEGAKQQSSKVEDIFGGTLSDSDLEDENVNVDLEDSRLSTYDDTYSETSAQATTSSGKKPYATEFSSDMFYHPQQSYVKGPEGSPSKSKKKQPKPSTSTVDPYLLGDYTQASGVGYKLQQLSLELEELKQRKQKTQQEIAGLENMTLRQRFQEILHNINKDIAFKEMEYQKLLSHK